MSAKILVTFATIHGSTQEVAEAVARTLRAEGLEADVLPARDVRSLDGYRAVILGAPLYMFRWHRHARGFLSRHQKALSGEGALPIAIFALGPFHNKEDELQMARDQLNKELAKYPRLKPAAVAAFVGKFDPTRLRFPYNLIPVIKNMPAADERDWDNIAAWTVSLAELWKS